MTPVIYLKVAIGLPGSRYVGFFADGTAELPVVFRGDNRGELHARMLAWLEVERAKVGLTAEAVERRKAALAAARIARKAKVSA